MNVGAKESLKDFGNNVKNKVVSAGRFLGRSIKNITRSAKKIPSTIRSKMQIASAKREANRLTKVRTAAEKGGAIQRVEDVFENYRSKHVPITPNKVKIKLESQEKAIKESENLLDAFYEKGENPGDIW